VRKEIFVSEKMPSKARCQVRQVDEIWKELLKSSIHETRQESSKSSSDILEPQPENGRLARRD
jgi:hypothetical protein